MSSVAQRSFSSGEITPDLYARTDQAKYAVGLRTCRNFRVLKTGGARNRPGTEYLATVKNSANPARLLPFIFSADQTYVLEFGDKYVRFYSAGASVVTSGVSAWQSSHAYVVGDLVTDGGVTYYCTTAHTSGASTEPGAGASWQAKWYAETGTIYELPTPYVATDLAGLMIAQRKDVLTLVHQSYPPYELRRYGETNWTLVPVAFGPAIATPANLAASGGTAGATTYYAVTAVDATTGEESLPATVSLAFVPASGTPIALTWDPVANAIGYNVYRSDDGGKTYGLLQEVTAGTQTATDNTWDTGAATATTTSQNTWVTAAGQARNTLAAVVSAATKATDGRYTITGTMTVSNTGAGASGFTWGRVTAYYSRNGEPRVQVDGTILDERVLGDGISTDFPLNATIDVPDNGYTSLVIDLVPEVNGYGTAGASFSCEIQGTAITWTEAEVGASDKAAVSPNMTVAPPKEPAMFDSPGNYPGVVGAYEQRQIYANTANQPESIWMSRPGLRTNFTTSFPSQDDDAVAFTLIDQQLNEIRHFVDVGRLMLFTSTGEWIVQGTADGVITPTEINPRKGAYVGSAAALRPQVVGNRVVYVQARGTQVRELRFDAIQGVLGEDLGIFSSHLLETYAITEWGYAQVPETTLWMIRSDGTLLGLTYQYEQAVVSWHRHDTQGTFEHLCIVPEGGEDVLYVLTNRTINGAAVRMVERFHSRLFTDVTVDAVFLDAALTYDGRNAGTTTLTLSGGTAWVYTESLTLTASAPQFAAGDVNDQYWLTGSDGSLVRCTVTAYSDSQHVTVQPDRTVPAKLQGIATATWSKAVKSVTGLLHLVGQHVGVLADGLVLASPNNSAYDLVTVDNTGTITLKEPHAVIHAGLPYVSDLETLDLDTPSGASLKEHKSLVNRIGVWLESSRGGWYGGREPGTGAVASTDPLDGLYEIKAREATDAYDSPTALVTKEVPLDIQSTWNRNGRIFLRQVDPLPLSVLALIPQGYLPQSSPSQ